MSVPAWRRNPNETLDLFMESMRFCEHILNITKNEKIFTLDMKTDITDRLKKDAIDIYTSLWIANTISLTRYPEERRRMQMRAQNCITDFMCIWCLAKVTFHLKSRKDKYVVDWLVAIRESVSKWMNSDVRRLRADNIESNDAK